MLKIPHEPFNTLVRKGSAGEIIKELKPESIYFTEQGGARGTVAIVNINDSSEIRHFQSLSS